MTWLRSLAFNVLFFVWTMGLGLLALPVLLAPWQGILMLARLWVRGSLLLLRLTCGIRVEVRGRGRVPAGPVIFASRHQSAWETMYWFLPFPDVAFVFKQELARIPVFGWYLTRAGQLTVDRAGGASALKSLVARAKAMTAEGRPVVIFPEGTRARPGEMLPLQRGIAAIYRACQVPVVPVHLDSGKYWGRNAFTKRAGTIVLEFLPPIAPGLDADTLMRDLAQAFSAAAAP